MARNEVDDRSQEVLRRTCSTEIGSQELTLFNNGTLRLKVRREREKNSMLLAELSRQEVRAFIRRFAEVDLSESESSADGLEGMGVERCELRLQLHESDPIATYWYGGFDTHTLAFSRIVAITEELRELAESRSLKSTIPASYRPVPGDVLLHISGTRYEVVAITGDADGVELSGIDSPITIYIRIEAIQDEFTALEPRQGGW